MRCDYLYDLDLTYRSHLEHEYTDLAGTVRLELLITYEANRPAREKITLYREPFFMAAQDGTVKLRMPILEAELKRFFENHKDYYYLPAEDMCVLKSVAHAVDPKHRENAKKETCYIRYRGLFIPQLDASAASFRPDYKSKTCYQQYRPEDITPGFCERCGALILKYLNS